MSMAPAPLSKFLSHLFTITTVFSSLLLLEFLILLRSIAKNLRKSRNLTLISTDRFLQLIEDSNPTIRYSTSVPEMANCVVCLSQFEEGENVRKLQCNHVFHKDCLDQWLLQPSCAAACPLCRINVLPEDYLPTQNEVDYDEDSEELLLFFSVLIGCVSH